MRLSPVLQLVDGEPAIWCPGCRASHKFYVNAAAPQTGARWTWDGNTYAPTFSPSLLLRLAWRGQRLIMCHSYVHGGRIEFLGETKHRLSGQSVQLPAWPSAAAVRP